MIYTERNIVIKNDTATINSPILLFRGDREVEIQFTIVDSKFRFQSSKGNIIDSTQASYGQLAIVLPDGADLLSDVVETQKGVVSFNITGEMIDELHEVGFYSFQIRLYNDDKTSRITLPPVMKGIEIREPLVMDDATADAAIVGYSRIQTYGVEEPAFDEDGNYIKTDWQTGDKITASKLNKIEETLETINNDIPTKTSELVNDSNFLTSVPSEYVTDSELNAKGYLTEHQDISNKADKSEIPTKTSQLTNDSNFLTSVPSEYVTDSELNAKGYLTEHQDISNKADKSEIPTKTSQLTNDSNFLTSVPSEYVTDSELNNKGYATEAYVDDNFDAQNFLIPDDFEGTDGEKLQACFDALKDTGGFISINREYILDRDIVINQDSNLNLQTTVKGIGEVSKINCGSYCFKGKEGVKHSWGGIKFSGLQITGTETMMQCANLIRVICSSCLISDFKYVCYSPDYTQSMYFNECVIRNISESVMFTEEPESTDSGTDGYLFDTRICFCLIEWCKCLLTSYSYSGCIVDNNCIEGFTGIPLMFYGKTRGVVIKNNYFEANEGGAIDLTDSSNKYSQGIVIDSNIFATSNNANVTILLPINRVIGSITISNNSVSSYATPLYEVPDSAKNYAGVYIYNNYGNTSGNTDIIDSNITKLDYANSVSNVLKGSVVDINNGVEARKLSNVRYFGKTIQDGVPSASSPSVPVSLLDKQTIKTYITTTKNILEITAATATVSGITFKVASGKIQLSGTTTADDVIFNINYEQGKLNVPVGTWRMSGPANTKMYIQLYVDGQLVGQTRNTETLVTVPEGATESYVRLKVNGKTGTSLSGYVSPMLVSSDDKDKSSTFEKFVKEFFSVTFSKHPYGLHGVPVDSGGNYTDSTGQQWFADCVDVAKGTIDRNFKEITLNGTETWAVQTYSNQPEGMYCYCLTLDDKRIGKSLSRCSHFRNVESCWEFSQGLSTFSDHGSNRYTYFVTDIATIEEWKSWLAANNVKFVYSIINMKSEQLSEANLSQFSVITVTKSHCRITNDKDCEMEVTYVVDTKSYVDNAIGNVRAEMFSGDYNDLTNAPTVQEIVQQVIDILNKNNS